jgi:hypothetical protein
MMLSGWHCTFIRKEEAVKAASEHCVHAASLHVREVLVPAKCQQWTLYLWNPRRVALLCEDARSCSEFVGWKSCVLDVSVDLRW